MTRHLARDVTSHTLPSLRSMKTCHWMRVMRVAYIACTFSHKTAVEPSLAHYAHCAASLNPASLTVHDHLQVPRIHIRTNHKLIDCPPSSLTVLRPSQEHYTTVFSKCSLSFCAEVETKINPRCSCSPVNAETQPRTLHNSILDMFSLILC